jgi:DNA-binding NarL/FixJ family response regulator
MSISVMVVDDHPVVRHGVRALLAGAAGHEVVAEASNGRDAVEIVRKTMPSVVLMEPAMPGLNGAEATSRIRKEFPKVAVVALSTHSDWRHVGRMLAAGAAGYVLKTCEPAELLRAIDAASRGETYLTPEVARGVVDRYRSGQDVAAAEGADLSGREREVLQLLAEGKSAKEIGQILHVSPRTIDSHRQRIMAKLSANGIAELTKCAIRMGLTNA